MKDPTDPGWMPPPARAIGAQTTDNAGTRPRDDLYSERQPTATSSPSHPDPTSQRSSRAATRLRIISARSSGPLQVYKQRLK